MSIFERFKSNVLPSHSREQTKQVIQNIKYESDLDHGFSDRIAKTAYGEKMLSCIQCGTCSATCPLSSYMDYTPRRIIQMVREGFKKEVLTSSTIWLCASCYSCMVECPRSIKITEVMYALKREAIEEKIYPKYFPIPVLARKFFSQVRKRGRLSEVWLIVSLYLATNPFAALKRAGLGWNMFIRKRLSLFEHGIKGKDQLNKLLDSVSKQGGVA